MTREAAADFATFFAAVAAAAAAAACHKSRMQLQKLSSNWYSKGHVCWYYKLYVGTWLIYVDCEIWRQLPFLQGFCPLNNENYGSVKWRDDKAKDVAATFTKNCACITETVI